MSCPLSSLVAGVKIGSANCEPCFKPAGRGIPHTAWLCWYSFQPDPSK